ncbi:hypothetical protein [Streptomyces sp. MZ04]|uniref:hypothetical protein n=1 Tax=Streptomyces sp. MZ04 TaxID=2559236 RepID=UPI00107EC839|nr:hypothetical protein [Streptomyces sp. MZ04]TGA85621.1 hypothetical protein E2651_41740 [Streptomyces sp. MZ04]
MNKFLLSVHVVLAILAVGPIAVAASMFPRYAKQLAADADADAEGQAAGVAGVLHKICRGYALFGIGVPVFGFATAARLGVLGDVWLIVSIALTAVAAAVLAMAILPNQQRMLAVAGGTAEPGTPAVPASRLAMLTGVFNLLWTVVVILMIVRPGSTTGA